MQLMFVINIFRCPHGQELVGPPEMCANINECTHNPCHYGQCIDHEYGFSCTCEPGYGGELCASPQQANIAYISTGFILAIVICALVLLCKLEAVATFDHIYLSFIWLNTSYVGVQL